MIKPINAPKTVAVTGSVRNHPEYINAIMRQLIDLQSPLHSPTPTVAPVIH